MFSNIIKNNLVFIYETQSNGHGPATLDFLAVFSVFSGTVAILTKNPIAEVWGTSSFIMG